MQPHLRIGEGKSDLEKTRGCGSGGEGNMLVKPEIFLAAFLKGFNTCGKSENEIRKRFIESQSLQLKLNAGRKVAFHI